LLVEQVRWDLIDELASRTRNVETLRKLKAELAEGG